MCKVLITSRSFGKVGNEPLNYLLNNGYEVDFYDSEYQEEQFIEKLRDYEGLIIGSHPLTEVAVKSASKLRCVIKHGTGLDNISQEMMKQNGIWVDNVPAANADAVADLTFALILDVARRVTYAHCCVQTGRWNRIIGVDVFGKTLSLIGFGAIGSRVAKRAKGFSMKVLVFDPNLKELPEEYRSYVTLLDKQATISGGDFLSLHIPLLPETKNMIGEYELESMKVGSFLINTSRGGLVDEIALCDAISSGHLRGAGVDVLEEEPLGSNHPFIGNERVVITSHIGMYSEEAVNAISLIAAKKMVEFLKKGRE